MRACNLGSVEVTQQSAEVPHQVASWVIRLAIKTTESGRHQVTIAQFYFCPLFHERGSLLMDMAMGGPRDRGPTKWHLSYTSFTFRKTRQKKQL